MISRADGIDDTLKHTKYSGRLANVIRIIQIYIYGSPSIVAAHLLIINLALTYYLQYN